MKNFWIIVFLAGLPLATGCGGSNSLRTLKQSASTTNKQVNDDLNLDEGESDPLAGYAVHQPIAQGPSPSPSPSPSVTNSPFSEADESEDRSDESTEDDSTEDTTESTMPSSHTEVLSFLGKGGTSYNKVDEACEKASARASEGAIALCESTGGSVTASDSTSCDCYHKAGYPSSYKICRVTTEVSCLIE